MPGMPFWPFRPSNPNIPLRPGKPADHRVQLDIHTLDSAVQRVHLTVFVRVTSLSVVARCSMCPRISGNTWPAFLTLVTRGTKLPVRA